MERVRQSLQQNVLIYSLQKKEKGKESLREYKGNPSPCARESKDEDDRYRARGRGVKCAQV